MKVNEETIKVLLADVARSPIPPSQSELDRRKLHKKICYHWQALQAFERSSRSHKGQAVHFVTWIPQHRQRAALIGKLLPLVEQYRHQYDKWPAPESWHVQTFENFLIEHCVAPKNSFHRKSVKHCVLLVIVFWVVYLLAVRVGFHLPPTSVISLPSIE